MVAAVSVTAGLWNPIDVSASDVKNLVYTRETFEFKELVQKTGEHTRLCIDEDIPEEVALYASIYGRMYNICPEFLEATMEHESQFVTTAVHESDIDHSVGPAQVNLKCKYHYDRMEKLGLTVEDLNTYEGAMYFMADLLCELFEDYEDPAEVLMRYNGDKTNLRKYWKTGEMSDYASEILERSMELERRHGK